MKFIEEIPAWYRISRDTNILLYKIEKQFREEETPIEKRIETYELILKKVQRKLNKLKNSAG